MIISRINGFSSSERFATASSVAPSANVDDFSIWAVVLPNTNTANQIIFGKTNSISSTVGWSLRGSTGNYSFHIGNGSSAIFSPPIGVATQEVDKIQIIHATIKDGWIYIYKNGFKCDGRTEISSIGTFDGALSIGSFSGGTAYQSSIISVGICATHGLSDSEVEAHYQALLLDVEASPINATYHWVAEDAGSTWIDRISSLSATRTGSITPSSADHSFFLPRFVDTDFEWSSIPLNPFIANIDGFMNFMPTGDSRTVGVGGGNTNAWRNGVSVLANATGDMNELDMVGSFGSDAIDPQHNARSGTSSTNHLNVTGDITLSPATNVANYSPRVVFIWLFVNSATTDSVITEEKEAYLDLIRAYHEADNNIRFILMDEATIQNGVQNAKMEEFRLWQRYTAWPLLASEGIKFVTCYNPLKPSLEHYADSVHPNNAGYAALATAIYQALRLALGVDYTAPIVISKLTGVSKLTGLTKLTI